MSISVPENVSSQTIHQVETQLSKMNVPIKLFKKMLVAAKDLDFTAISDPVIQNRYMTSRETVSEYFNSVVRMDVYEGSDTYDEFMEFIITLFAIFDALVKGRLYISDIAMQDSTVVNEFLDSYGFEIRRIFENDINTDIAENVYGYIRKKGTPQLLAILLSNLGVNHFQIDEYYLNKIDGEYYLIPNTIYMTDDMTEAIDVKPVKYTEIDDVLKTLSEEELDVLYKRSVEDFS